MPGTDAVIQLGYDPWWRTPEKQNSSNPEVAIIFACLDGEIYRSESLGTTWAKLMLETDPPNDWSDDPAPTVADLSFVQRTDNIHKDGHHYFLANWQNASSQWRSWLLVTEDDGSTWTWVSLHDLFAGGECDATYCYANFLAIRENENADVLISASGVFSGDAGGTPTVSTKTYKSGGGGKSLVYWVADLGEEVSRTAAYAIINVHTKSDAPAGDCANGFFGTTSTNIAYSTDDVTYTQTEGPGSRDWRSETGSYEWKAEAGALGPLRYIRLTASINAESGDCDGWTMEIDSIRVSNTDGTGGAPDELQSIWADVGSGAGGVLYLTVWKGNDTLALLPINTGTYTAEGSEVSLGGCTAAELAGGTYYAAPYTPTFNDDRVYIFGRMSSPAGLSGTHHLIQSTDTGATFTSKESGLGTDLVTNFRAEGEADGARTFYAMVCGSGHSPRFYRGTESIALISTISGFASGDILNVDAFTVEVIDGVGKIAAGSPSANAVMVVQSTDNGATWSDVTLNLPITGEIKSVVWV